MNRRQVLQQLGWGISGGLLVPSFIASCAKKDPGPEILFDGSVAVIGAGAAGLYVADILRSKGINVKVFEAREQIGGRVRSLRNQSIEKYPLAPLMASDFPIELGAQTIIGTDSVFGKIFQDYSLPTIEYSPSANHFVLDNKPKSDTDWGGDADFVAARNFRNNLAGRAGSSASAQQSILAEGIGARAFGMLNAQIGNAYGSNNERIGIGALGEAERLRTNDGKIIGLRANPMQDALISRFSAVQSSVQLNTPITNINYGADPIVLTAKDGSSYEANKVIVTVPVSILKNGGLSFSPGLPGGITSSLAKIGMGASLRVV
ncbi:MAG: FAD-dependent oxidoreductase, partial [Cyclobacteriaceae bacterium]|nr:FAD-dependent oxidoreductase [Cyclobacteriaceae bacterium]